jgi:hypothetical protein
LVYETRSYNWLGSPTLVERWYGSARMKKTEYSYDVLGRSVEVKTHGVNAGGTTTGYQLTKTWRDARGLVVKVQRDGKVFEKTQYDGAGRVMNRALCFDIDEATYAEAGKRSRATLSSRRPGPSTTV